MIKYPSFENPNTCGEPYFHFDSDLHVKTNIGICRAITQIGTSLNSEHQKRQELENQLRTDRKTHDETLQKLIYAEQQEEICGQIAKGEFSKRDGINTEPAYFSGEGFHPYTDSQKAVKALLEREKQLIAGAVSDGKKINELRSVFDQACEDKSKLLDEINRLRTANSKLHLEIRKAAANRKRK